MHAACTIVESLQPLLATSELDLVVALTTVQSIEIAYPGRPSRPAPITTLQSCVRRRFAQVRTTQRLGPILPTNSTAGGLLAGPATEFRPPPELLLWSFSLHSPCRSRGFFCCVYITVKSINQVGDDTSRKFSENFLCISFPAWPTIQPQLNGRQL